MLLVVGLRFVKTLVHCIQDGLNVVSEARVAGEDLQGRHKKRKTKEERMKSVLEGDACFSCMFAVIRNSLVLLSCLPECSAACVGVLVLNWV